MADAPAPVESHAEALRGTPPASNPGADDATAGIAPDAGGVSGAAHKDIENPATTAQKRRSVFGSVKGLLGLDKKSTNQSSTASDGTYIGAATAAVTGTVAAVTEKVSALTTGPTDGSKFANDAAATVLRDEDLEYVPTEKPTAETATTGATGAAAEKHESAAADSKDVAATESTADPAATAAATSASETPAGEVVKTTPEEAVKTDTEAQPVVTEKEEKAAEKEEVTGEEGTEDGEHKPPQPAHNTNLQNPDAIPVAGGVKVGEEHAGESNIIPEDPLKPTAEEKSKGAVARNADGEVADNTAKNTGSATGGPGAVPAPAGESSTSPSSPGGESTKEKGKGLINKLKSKIKKNKE